MEKHHKTVDKTIVVVHSQEDYLKSNRLMAAPRAQLVSMPLIFFTSYR